MAEFIVREVEGMRQVRIDIRDETVRARAGALSKYQGDIAFTPRVPRVRDLFRSLFIEEARVRPYYTGTGSIMLQPSLGGFHIARVPPDETWILEPGVYWASDGGVDIALWKERFWPSLWAGDGFVPWKTRVQGDGCVAINAPGPVETIDVDDSELTVQGRLVLGRTDGLRFYSRRSAPFPRNFLSGQKRMRVFKGTGRVLVCWTPYWNQHMYQNLTGQTIERSLFE
jgi:uncharacterized protein (AIM24 family)